MVKLSLHNLTKQYRRGQYALNDFSLDIKEGEFLLILGPSGSGKTTLLRILAGLEDRFSGDILLDGVPFEQTDPRDRGIAMVFQNYALYPQMSARMNLSLPLKQPNFRFPVYQKDGTPLLEPDQRKIAAWKKEMKSLPKEQRKELQEKIKEEKSHPSSPVYRYRALGEEEIASRISRVSEILGLSSFLEQGTSTLSGGQKQRIALGKALVREPKILLLDEPLSNLDNAARLEARALIRSVHERVGATTIMVSHDQADAFSLADRVVVMNQGRILQIGEVEELYRLPDEAMVARMIGLPGINLLECAVDGDCLIPLESNWRIPLSEPQKEAIGSRKEVLLGLRSEDISLCEDGHPIEVEREELIGKVLLGHFSVGEQDVSFRLEKRLDRGSKAMIRWNGESILLFDAENEKRIYPLQ